MSNKNIEAIESKEILYDLVSGELTKKAVVIPTIINLSDRIEKGVSEVSVPNRGAYTVEDTPNNGDELEGSDLSYVPDILLINKNKTVSDYIYDTEQAKTKLDLTEDFYEGAATPLAEKIETDAVAVLVAAAKAKGHTKQLAGTGNKAITLDQIGDLNEEMNTANIPKTDRYLVVSPRQARIIRGFPEVRDYSKLGTEPVLANGFVTKLEGFIVLESNDLTAFECLAYQSNLAGAFGLTKEFKADEERQSSKKRVFVSVDASYGAMARKEGRHIWYLSDAAVAP